MNFLKSFFLQFYKYQSELNKFFVSLNIVIFNFSPSKHFI